MFRVNEKSKRTLAYIIAGVMILGTFASLFAAIFTGYASPGLF